MLSLVCFTTSCTTCQRIQIRHLHQTHSTCSQHLQQPTRQPMKSARLISVSVITTGGTVVRFFAQPALSVAMITHTAQPTLRSTQRKKFHPLLPFPSLFSFLSPPLPLEVGPLIAGRGSGGALKLPQRVRAEPGCQTVFGEFQAKNRASSRLILRSFSWRSGHGGGMEERTYGPMDLLPAKFHRDRCNVSPLRGEKPKNWLVSKNNTGRAACGRSCR